MLKKEPLKWEEQGRKRAKLPQKSMALHIREHFLAAKA